MAAAYAASGYAAIHVASTRALARLDQALLRPVFCDVAEIRVRDVSRRGRQRSKCFYWHKKITFPKSAAWRAEPSILRPDGRSVIGSAGYAVRTRNRVERSGEYSKGDGVRKGYF